MLNLKKEVMNKNVIISLTYELKSYLDLIAFYQEKAVEITENIKKHVNGEYETD